MYEYYSKRQSNLTDEGRLQKNKQQRELYGKRERKPQTEELRLKHTEYQKEQRKKPLTEEQQLKWDEFNRERRGKLQTEER